MVHLYVFGIFLSNEKLLKVKAFPDGKLISRLESILVLSSDNGAILCDNSNIFVSEMFLSALPADIGGLEVPVQPLSNIVTLNREKTVLL